MTALEKYRKLEGAGLWAASRDSQRRDVIVSFGDATLVILDSRSMQALSHWSLPAVQRLNPGKRPALYAPEGDDSEILELQDDWLIDALRTVQGALHPPRSVLSRFRRPVMAGIAIACAIAVAVAVPPALVTHTASVVPMAKRAELGMQIRTDLRRLGAQECSTPNGDAALVSLQRALFQTPAQIVVMRNLPVGASRVQQIMGRYFIIDARMLDEAGYADALAGAILLAAQRAADTDPLHSALRHAGIVATFRLLTSAELPAGALRGYAEQMLRTQQPVPELEPLLERFARVELSTRPLVDNPTVLDNALTVLAGPLRESDPMAGELPGSALLSDGQWVSLQNICDT